MSTTTIMSDEAVAVVGMSVRVPGARCLSRFWQNLEAGRDTVRTFTEEELREAGVSANTLAHPAYIPRKPFVDGVADFDVDYFRTSPREAALLDPQQRLLLECAYEALHDAGIAPRHVDATTGVFVSGKLSQYLIQHIWPRLASDPGMGFEALISNDKDYLATQLSYRLDLHGPSMSIQTACSSSLSAISVAVQNLYSYQCDVALAGGVALGLPLISGYLHIEGGPFSRDGRCRPFDREASGTVFGDGAGVVVLKRLADAVADGDDIYAVVLGSAVTNDGARRVGFTAPGVEGQREAASLALGVAGVGPASIELIEAHGSGTVLGDPIEVAALAQAYSTGRSDRARGCVLGSVKSNLGHLENAAGIASFVKAVLALRHRVLPPTAHFEVPNPDLELESTPFSILAEARPWEPGSEPRRAAVASVGIGGTNVHLVLEEAPARALPRSAERPQFLTLSSHRADLLDGAAEALATHMESAGGGSLEQVAWTLQKSQSQGEHRRTVVAGDWTRAIEALRDPAEFVDGKAPDARQAAFLLPGVGDQYRGVGAALYRTNDVFRESMDRGCRFLLERTGQDVLGLFTTKDDLAAEKPMDFAAMVGRGSRKREDTVLSQTLIAQPGVFVFELALARAWAAYGVEPSALLGYSVGEYVAATIAGVFEFEDALHVVSERARLIEALPEGGMVAVLGSREDILPLLEEDAYLAAVNGPGQCVLSGGLTGLDRVVARLDEAGLTHRRLEAKHPFHSPLMAEVSEKLVALFDTVRLRAPQIPIVSNVTGNWLSPEEATNGRYWARHLQQTIEFDRCLSTLRSSDPGVLLEVGSGRALCSMAQQHGTAHDLHTVASTPSRFEATDAAVYWTHALGRLHGHGVAIAWDAVSGGNACGATHLPAPPLHRERFWIARPEDQPGAVRALETRKNENLHEWFYVPVWEEHRPAAGSGATSARSGELCILYDDASEAVGKLASELLATGCRLVRVFEGEEFVRLEPGRTTGGEEAIFELDPRSDEHPGRLLEACGAAGRVTWIHTWSGLNSATSGSRGVDATIDRSYHSLVHVVQAIQEYGLDSVRLTVVTSGLFSVTGVDADVPERAVLMGPVLAIPREVPTCTAHVLDVDAAIVDDADGYAERVIGELANESPERLLVARGSRCWVRRYRPVEMEAVAESARQDGLRVLITGGLGELGLGLARALAERGCCSLALITRRELPARSDWDTSVADKFDDLTKEVIARILELEGMGARVSVHRADVADRVSLARALEEVRATLGGIDRILHAAGVLESGLMALKSREQSNRVIAPKVQGTLNLLELTTSDRVESFALFSSTAAMSPPAGEVDHCAGNAAMDAIAELHREEGRPVVSINWGPWESRFMEQPMESVPPHLQGRFDAYRRLGAIRIDEGLDCLEHAVTAGWSRVVISSRLVDVMGHGAIEPTTPSESGATRPALLDDVSARRQRPSLSNPYLAPETETQERVASVWAELLGVDEIGIDDHFLEIGGNSLLASQLVAELRASFSTGLTLREILGSPTVRAVALYLDEDRTGTSVDDESAPSTALCDRSQVSEEGRAGPASHAQERMWVQEQLELDGTIHNQSIALRLRGELCRPALSSALADVVALHEGLRTRFELREGGLWQIVEPPFAPQLRNVGDAPPRKGSVPEQARGLAALDLDEPFSLSDGRLMRARLARLANNDYLLMLSIHHIAADGWSFGILLRDFVRAYTSRSEGGSPILPALGGSRNIELASVERVRLTPARIDAGVDAWRRVLAGAPETRFPADVDSGTGPVAAVVKAAEPVSLLRSLEALSVRHKVTLQTVLLAAYAIVLSRHLSDDDLTLSTDVANRNCIESQGAVGFFVNQVVLRMRLAEAKDFGDVVALVQNVALDAFSLAEVPFSEVAKSLRLGRRAMTMPKFSHQSFADLSVDVGGLNIEFVDSFIGGSGFELCLLTSDSSSGLTMKLHFDAGRIDYKTAEALVREYRSVLTAAARGDAIRLSEVRGAARSERGGRPTVLAGGRRKLVRALEVAERGTQRVLEP